MRACNLPRATMLMVVLVACTSTTHDVTRKAPAPADGASGHDSGLQGGDASPLDGESQGDSGTGWAACAAAGGQCVLGNVSCAHKGTVDCDPDRNPGGAFCCLDQSCTGANPPVIKASDYDQSCHSDADCLAVGVGDACTDCAIACTSAAINVAAKSRYLADVAKTPAGQQTGSSVCNCPAEFSPCCVSGACRADSQCSSH